jgi:type VI secretion system protein ImpA
MEGFEGLAAGLKLTGGLLDTFWDKLHPGLDEDEIIIAIRGRPLAWLGTSKDFMKAVDSCPLVTGADGRPLTWGDYLNTELVDDRRSKSDQSSYDDLIAAGFLSSEDWNARISGVDIGQLRQALGHVTECESALHELRALCEKYFEEDEPSMVALGERLYDVREYLTERVPAGGDEELGEVELDESGVPVEGAAAVAGPQASGGPIASRDDALKRLLEVAEYFQRVEPHSPISYLIKRTVRWGSMPLAALLEEIVQDESVLSRIWETLGIVQSDGSEE